LYTLNDCGSLVSTIQPAADYSLSADGNTTQGDLNMADYGTQNEEDIWDKDITNGSSTFKRN